MIVTAPAGLWLVTVDNASDDVWVAAYAVLAVRPPDDSGTIPELLTNDGWHDSYRSVVPTKFVAAAIYAIAREAVADDRGFVLIGAAAFLVDGDRLEHILEQTPARLAEQRAQEVSQMVQALDCWGVPLDATRQQAGDALERVGARRGRAAVLVAALQQRRDR